MKTDRYKIYFFHIIEAIEKLELIADTTTKEEFLADWLKQDAVLKNFIVIGEAIVLGLCEEADFGAQNCQHTTKVDAR